jgi:hypothetical protein
LLAYRTTDKCPAFPLVSRPYRIGYNALAVLVILPPLPSLDPLSGQAFNISFLYSIVKVRFGFLFFEPF